MTLFSRQQHKALVFALVATMLACALARQGFAGSTNGNGPVDPDAPGGSGKGDPDVPTGPAARKAVPGVQQIVAVPSRGPITVGDGAVPYSSWTWRIRIVLRGLRVYTFHF